ncbi:DUF86 domain-containing protein [Candidatus Woesearchaeota archaeon]|nr:DUF86 domain-containing protein [Candidatus Woesearchaeota archaeon]
MKQELYSEAVLNLAASVGNPTIHGWEDVIEHIIGSIENIELFMEEISKENFFKNEEKQSAVIRKLEIIGEAAKNLPNNFRNKYDKIPWKDISGMRDKLMHHYFGVNLETVWKTIKEDIPDLKEKMLELKKVLKEKVKKKG